MPEAVSIGDLLDRHAGVLLDAYGILVDAHGALPGAAALLAELRRRGLPHAVVTNDASRSAATCEARFARYGLPIPAAQIVTSGSLLPAYFARHAGARTCVLGTADSCAYVAAGGGVPIAVEAGMTVDAVAICDDSGTPFLDGIELALSAIVRAVDAGRRPVLVVPNPDLVYPKRDGELGFTAGAMALVIEAALARRFPTLRLVFDRLGKPAPELFRAGAACLGLPVHRLVMIGDQLETDIAGARAAGMASALLAGISTWSGDSAIAPDYLLATIAP